MKVAIATCRPLPEPDVDEPLLLSALAEAGIDAEMTAWRDRRIDWTSYDACVVRSTWDYLEAPDEFAAWISQVASQTVLYNPAGVMRGNIHKRYLLDLEKVGVRIVPTRIFPQGANAVTADLFEGRAIVIKPAISAGSWLTRLFRTPSEGLHYLHKHLAQRDMMVQPYLPSVEQHQEVSWCWIDGVVTHGVRKSPRFSEGDEKVSDAIFPTEADQKLVADIMRHVPDHLLYARVDLMEDDGQWLLSELELIEPSLFFKQNPAAIQTFIGALQRRIAWT